MWGVNQVVAILHMLFIPELFNLVTHHTAVGMPEDESLPNFVVGGVKVKFLANLAMVAFAGFFKAPEVILEGVFAFPCRAINALKHGAIFIAAPVGTRYIEQFDGVWIDF